LNTGFNTIPVIDLFAGPGGLGEGFAASTTLEGKPIFKLVLSIEKDFYAHRTLELRAFFRQFERGTVPEEYYAYLKGKISRDSLFRSYPEQARTASDIAWHAELGSGRFPAEVIDARVKAALKYDKTGFSSVAHLARRIPL
jgi:DNA (cytosine-5)-methyltransferase 1